MAIAQPKFRLPSPEEIGLPAKFDKWRSGQEQFLNVIITSEKRFKIGCAPTGFGKSPAVVGAALYSKKPTCIVTATKGLQDQYMEDFAECGMVSIKGRANYNCGMREDYTCEEGAAARCPNHGSVMCPSSQAEMAAAASPLVVTNYSKWTASRKYGTGMSHFTQVVFDEGDEAPDAIAAAMQVVLSVKEVEKDLKMAFPAQHEAEEMAIWKTWAKHAASTAEFEMQAAQARITGVSKPKPTHVKHYTHMRNLWRRLTIIRAAKPEDWVVEEIKDGYQFDPIRIGRYAESTLLLQVPSVIFVSATIRPKTAYMMWIPQTKFEFHEFESTFPKKRHPVYYKPVMRVDNRATSLSQLWLFLDQIAAMRQDRKGVVHTISYQKRKDIVLASRFAQNMIFNEPGAPVSEALDAFFSSGPGTILVTPSVESGYDFKFKKCEWQMMCKIPFDPPSKILKAREADDKEYRAYKAMRRLVQSVGRGMRDKEDQCVSPDTKILTHDLRWVEAGTLRRGSRLLSAAEYGPKVDGAHKTSPRLWTEAIVQAVKETSDFAFRIVLSDGLVIKCTYKHPLLECLKKGHTSVWTPANRLKVGSTLVRVLDTWKDPTSYDAGWLAGFIDGEGCLTQTLSERSRNVQRVMISQNEGPSLNRLLWSLDQFDFDYNLSEAKRCKVAQIKGGLPEVWRLLGSIRPTRLLTKFTEQNRTEKIKALSYPTVVSIEPIGEIDIVRLQTTSKTYITGGVPSHNCEFFLGDEHLEWFFPRYKHLAPGHFSLTPINQVPPPPPRLA